MQFYPMMNVIKAGLKDKSGNTVWMIASTEDRDEDGEELVQKAMDVSYMPKDGKVLWGHSPQFGPPHPENILGEITLARVEKPGVYIESTFMPWKEKAAVILNDLQQASELNMPMNAYKASIEGQYKIFYGPKGEIQKSAIVRNVALDSNVVNTNTMIGILKSTNGAGNHYCKCGSELKNLNTTEQKVRLLVEHMIVCKGMNNFNEVRRTIAAILKRRESL